MKKNGCISLGNTEMYYVSFGSGGKKLVVLPGLSDGLATVKGKALVLSAPYGKFFRDYTVYMFSRKNDMPAGYSIKDMADDQILGRVVRKLQHIETQLVGPRHLESRQRTALTGPEKAGTKEKGGQHRRQEAC